MNFTDDVEQESLKFSLCILQTTLEKKTVEKFGFSFNYMT